ncbi:MAG: SufD family Fe-S cluster assembly protein [Treponema sp.]|nr:SufD family Fe-S cluster assembly protein [Treponema sp.]
MEQTIDINPIPYLTWTWLKINKDTVTYDFSLSENNGNLIQVPDGISITSGKTIKTELPQPESSIGQEAAKLISDAATEGKIYTFEKSEAGDNSKPLIIRINADSNCTTHNIIHAKAGVKCKIIIVYEGGSNMQSSLSGVITKIYAEDDSNVQLTKVQLCKNAVNQIDDTQTVCGERAKVSIIQVELGGAHTDASFHTTLSGYQSKFESDTAYICKGSQYIDLNQTVVHTGKKTECNMKTDGTVKDATTKTYRGTIDMRTGCSGSQGNEMETTLLLSPTAVVKAAPIILCGEDDISAEHGSTIGKLSPEMLFYMNSRGIDQQTAEALLTRAKITATASKIPDEAIRQEIDSWLNREFGED